MINRFLWLVCLVAVCCRYMSSVVWLLQGPSLFLSLLLSVFVWQPSWPMLSYFLSYFDLIYCVLVALWFCDFCSLLSFLVGCLPCSSVCLSFCLRTCLLPTRNLGLSFAQAPWHLHSGCLAFSDILSFLSVLLTVFLWLHGRSPCISLFLSIPYISLCASIPAVSFSCFSLSLCLSLLMSVSQAIAF